MNAKKTNDTSDDAALGDDFSENSGDLNEDLGDLGEENFDDYDLNDAEEEPGTETSNEESALAGEEAAPLEDLPVGDKPAKKGIVDLIKENWLFIVIGIVVISIAGYMISGVLSPSTPAPAPQQQQQTQGNFPLPQQQAQQQQAPENAAPAGQAQAAATPTAPTPGQTNIVMSADDMQTLMQGFQKMVQQNSQDIQKSLQTIIDNTNQANSNEEAINAMQSEFANLGKEIKNYSQNISALNKRLDTLQTQLTILVAQQTAQQEKLTLRAVVPGRAWLIDGKGRTISVTEGTSLGNFGIVTNIDSKAGEVDTSSGYIFK